MKSLIHKQFFISAAITFGISCPSNVIPQPLTRPSFNNVDVYSKKSFITKAVERTGSSVVTIDTQRYVMQRKSQEILHFYSTHILKDFLD